jgi:hypothetical protein
MDDTERLSHQLGERSRQGLDEHRAQDARGRPSLPSPPYRT